MPENKHAKRVKRGAGDQRKNDWRLKVRSEGLRTAENKQETEKVGTK